MSLNYFSSKCYYANCLTKALFRQIGKCIFTDLSHAFRLTICLFIHIRTGPCAFTFAHLHIGHFYPNQLTIETGCNWAIERCETSAFAFLFNQGMTVPPTYVYCSSCPIKLCCKLVMKFLMENFQYYLDLCIFLILNFQ